MEEKGISTTTTTATTTTNTKGTYCDDLPMVAGATPPRFVPHDAIGVIVSFLTVGQRCLLSRIHKSFSDAVNEYHPVPKIPKAKELKQEWSSVTKWVLSSSESDAFGPEEVGRVTSGLDKFHDIVQVHCYHYGGASTTFMNVPPFHAKELLCGDCLDEQLIKKILARAVWVDSTKGSSSKSKMDEAPPPSKNDFQVIVNALAEGSDEQFFSGFEGNYVDHATPEEFFHETGTFLFHRVVGVPRAPPSWYLEAEDNAHDEEELETLKAKIGRPPAKMMGGCMWHLTGSEAGKKLRDNGGPFGFQDMSFYFLYQRSDSTDLDPKYTAVVVTGVTD